eukprot:NODE_168_length_14557_cov_0.729008.p8 type:complete len:206 gc:universal NODE_168_length_14557_cov_0.729008:2537-3154(+)
MRNKTSIIFAKIPKSNFEVQNRPSDIFVTISIGLLNKMTENCDKHAIIKEINNLANTAKNDYQKKIVAILNDKFVLLKKKSTSLSDPSGQLSDRTYSNNPTQKQITGFGLQQLVQDRKSTLNLSFLEDTLQEISALQSTLGQHLQEQSERISILNTDADITEQNLDLGNLELQKAIIEMSKSRSWFVYTLCILSSVLLFMDWYHD